MDNIQFLDLIGLGKQEIDRILSCLFDGPIRASLPWYFGKKSAKAKIPSTQNQCNGISADNFEGPLAHCVLPYNPSQVPTVIPNNFQHTPQVIASVDVLPTNQEYNHTQVPLQHPVKTTEEVPMLNGESPVRDEQPQDSVVNSTRSEGANNVPRAEPEVRREITKGDKATTITKEITKTSPKISSEKNGTKKISPSRKKTKFSKFEQKDTAPIVKEKTEVKSVDNQVKENGVQHEIAAPVNAWNKKPGTTLFKKDATLTNGHSAVESSKIVPSKLQKKPPVLNSATFILGEFLANHTINGTSTYLQPRGLLNKSNYCYVNSILQALLACPPLCNLLKELNDNLGSICSNQSIPMIDNMCKFINEFCEIPDSCQPTKSKKNKKKRGSFDYSYLEAFEATSFYTLLNGTRSDSFLVEGRQEDAEEFLGLLLNGLNDEMISIMKLIQEDISSSHTEASQDSDDWKVMGPKNKGNITRKVQFDKTPISDIFGGLLSSRIHKTGDQSTVNIQPFFTLQLNIETANTISEALEQLTVKNKIEGLTSSKTNKVVEAYQQVMIEQLPRVLVLHLKCFDYREAGLTKIMKVLDFPIDLHIDAKILSGKTSSVSEKHYKLFAVVYHEGKEASKGHYIADVFHTGYNTWMRFDDSKIKSVSEENVMKPTGNRIPYLLFYKRD